MPVNRSLLYSCGLTVFVASTLAFGTAQRTFVASNGNDGNPCTTTAPCRGFGAAVTQTTAAGEVIVQDSAGYGSVTITKAISIIAPPGVYAGISVLSGNGITVNAPGATIVLRGLSINGQGGMHGIFVQQANRVRVENCVVSNMNGLGIYHAAANAEMIVVDSIVRDNGDAGIGMLAVDASIVLDRVRSEHNQFDGFYVAPDFSSTLAKASVTDSVFANNGYGASYGGIWANTNYAATTEILVERTVFSNNNGYGFRATPINTAGAVVHATLTRNSFESSGGNGILSLGTTPALAITYASENALHDKSDILSDGDGSQVYASGNTGNSALKCDHGGSFVSLKNNNVAGVAPGSGCSITIQSGF